MPPSDSKAHFSSKNGSFFFSVDIKWNYLNFLIKEAVFDD